MNPHALQTFFASIPLDWFIIAIIVLAIVIDVMRSGTNRELTFALAFPFALQLFSFIPATAVLGSVLSPSMGLVAQAIVFFACAAGSYFLIGRLLSAYGGMFGTILNALLAAVAVVIIILVVWVQVPALLSLWHIGAGLQAVFGAAYRLWWLLAAYGMLAFARG